MCLRRLQFAGCSCFRQLYTGQGQFKRSWLWMSCSTQSPKPLLDDFGVKLRLIDPLESDWGCSSQDRAPLQWAFKLGTEKVPQRNCMTKILPNIRVNFLVRFASKPFFYWVMTGNPSNCSENSLVLFVRFFGFMGPFWPPIKGCFGAFLGSP